MKILFVAPRFHTNQYEAVKTLHKKGHSVHFHVATEGATEDHELLEPVIHPESVVSKAIRMLFGDGGANKRRYFPALLTYWRNFRNLSPDVVIIRIHGLVFSILAALFGRMTNARVVFYHQIDSGELANIYNESSLSLKRIKYYLPLKLLNAYLMTPLLNWDQTEEKLPPRCHYVPFAVRVFDKVKPVSSPLRFLMIGKYVRRKNHHLLIEAAESLATEFNFEVTLIGEVSSDEHAVLFRTLQERITGTGLDSKVQLVKNVPYRKIGDYYAAHDVFVLPATDEPAAVSPLEAMGFGLPVITSNSNGTKTYIREGVNGFVVNHLDSNSIAESMRYFLNAPNEAASMSRTTLEYAGDHLSGANFYSSFVKMVNSIN